MLQNDDADKQTTEINNGSHNLKLRLVLVKDTNIS